MFDNRTRVQILVCKYLDFADICVCCKFPMTLKGCLLFPLTIIICLIAGIMLDIEMLLRKLKL